MKKLILATCLLSSAAFAEEIPTSAEFTVGFIPTQDVKLKTGAGSTTLGNDGYYFRAALNSDKFKVFGSMQQVDGSTCGASCIDHEVTETRGGLAFTVIDNGQIKLTPRIEYVTLELSGSSTGGSLLSTGNGVAVGADATLAASSSVDLNGGMSYLKLEDSTGAEFMLGATFKTKMVNFVIEGRHVQLDDSKNDLETTSNELKLGLHKAFSF